MITLKENERILMTLHKHWLVIVGRVIFIFILGAAPFLVPLFTDELSRMIDPASVGPLLIFISALYWLALTLLFFIEWLNYWLNALIITDTRIIDIEQKSLFRRSASEFALSRVQDVTIEVPGIIATFFKFGNITIQTAGEVNFTAWSVPEINKAKDVILACATKAKRGEQENI